jgi:hypothetical protein
MPGLASLGLRRIEAPQEVGEAFGIVFDAEDNLQAASKHVEMRLGHECKSHGFFGRHIAPSPGAAGGSSELL